MTLYTICIDLLMIGFKVLLLSSGIRPT